MRIAQVLLAPRIGGAETIASALQEELEARGHVLSMHHLDPAVGQRGRVERARHLRASLASASPDVVVGHGALPNIYARAVVPGRRVVTVLHSAIDDFADRQIRIAERVLRRRTAAVVAVSPELRAQYRSRFGDRVPVHVIANGVARAFVPPVSAPDAAPHRVVTLARVAEQKDPLTWIRAAAGIVEARGDVVVEWFGPDDETIRLGERVAALPDSVGDRIRFRGPVTDPVSVLHGASLLLHTAVAESQGLALYEAAACGVPVVCSSGLDPGIVTDVAAITFSPQDASGAASAALTALQDRPSSPGRLEVASRIRADYGMEACATRYEALLLEHAARH